MNIIGPYLAEKLTLLKGQNQHICFLPCWKRTLLKAQNKHNWSFLPLLKSFPCLKTKINKFGPYLARKYPGKKSSSSKALECRLILSKNMSIYFYWFFDENRSICRSLAISVLDYDFRMNTSFIISFYFFYYYLSFF